MPERAPNIASRGLLLCCGIFISLLHKVVSYVVFCASQGYAVVHSVVLWENSKAGRVALVLWAVGCCAGLVDSLSWWAVDRLKGLWISKGKTRVLALYPKSYPPKERMFFAQEMLYSIPFSTISK